MTPATPAASPLVASPGSARTLPIDHLRATLN